MLLSGGKSGLVRLSDSLKTLLDLCEASTLKMLRLAEPHMAAYRQVQQLAKQHLAGKIALSDDNREMLDALKSVPPDTQRELMYLQAHEIHSLSLTCVLTSCFCLESYVNSLAYFLFNEADLLGLIRSGNESSSEVLIDAISRMTVRDKWQTVGRLKQGQGFDPARLPFQDFNVLFRFRDDQVHDKVVEWGKLDPQKRYNGKLPDGVTEPLSLEHALFAASTYWSMVQEVHRLTGVPQTDFHRHYNLAPWLNETRPREIEQIVGKVRTLKA